MKQQNLFDSDNSDAENNSKYTRSARAPQYIPSERKPDLFELYDADKYGTLIAEINKSSLPEEEKQFLRLAATRHIVFNYSKIADYYANSDKQVQELMEKSALVIIDLEDAIANGYVQFSKLVTNVMQETGEDPKNAK